MPASPSSAISCSATSIRSRPRPGSITAAACRCCATAYAKYNVYPVGVSWWGVESIVSKKQITTMEDFKGVKFRSPQGMTAEILTKLGASIVVLPGGEVFSALDKGVVDAADWATHLDEPAHGLPRGRQVPDQAVPLDAGAGILRQHGRLEEARPTTSRRCCPPPCASGPGTRSSAWRSTTCASRRNSRPRASRAASGPTPRWSKIRALAEQDLGRLVEEDAARQAGLRLAARLAQGSQGRRVSARGGAGGRAPRAAPAGAAPADRFCDAVDRVNTWVGRVLGASHLRRHRRRPLRGGRARRVRPGDHLGQRDDDLPVGRAPTC